MIDFDANLVALHRANHTVVMMKERMQRARQFLHETYLEIEAEIGGRDSDDNLVVLEASAAAATAARARKTVETAGFRAPSRGHGDSQG